MSTISDGVVGVPWRRRFDNTVLSCVLLSIGVS